MSSASSLAPESLGGPPVPQRRVIDATWLGRRPYLETWGLQEALAARVRAGATERLLLLEHDPVYTIGRRGSLDHLLASPEELRARGATAYRVDRGGDITYHGPGQLVGYPILHLGDAPDLVAYVRSIEGALIDTLAMDGVSARTIAGKTGVWVELADGREAKIAAIGVRVSRGVTTHGFALNVSTDLDAFGRMVPCGFAHEVASVSRLGTSASMMDIAERCALALSERLGRSLRWSRTVPVTTDADIPLDSPVRGAADLLAEPVPA